MPPWAHRLGRLSQRPSSPFQIRRRANMVNPPKADHPIGVAPAILGGKTGRKAFTFSSKFCPGPINRAALNCARENVPSQRRLYEKDARV